MTSSERFLRWLLVLSLVLVGLYFCRDLQIRDNALDLLPEGAVASDIRLLQQMGLVDRLFITLTATEAGETGKSLEQLGEGIDLLAAGLAKSERFIWILSRIAESSGRELLQQLDAVLPYLLEDDDWQRLEKMTSDEAIGQRLGELFGLLNSPAGMLAKERSRVDPLALQGLVLPKLQYLRSEMAVELKGGLLVSSDSRSALLIAQSRSPLTDSAVAEDIARILASLQEQLGPGYEIRTLGTLPHTLANSRAVQHDLKSLLPMAALALVVMLLLTMRSPLALLLWLMPVMAAPPALALTRLIYPQTGALALGFGIVLLGIALDFAIHLYLHKKAHGVNSMGGGGATNLVKPLSFALLTTVGVFAVLLYSQVPSHRQMALLAIFGVTMALVISLILVPTLIPLQGTSGVLVSLRSGSTATWLRLPALLLWLSLLAGGVASWPSLHFNGDLRVLDSPDPKVLADEKHFQQTWGDKGEQAFVLVRGESLEQLLSRNHRLYRFLLSQGMDGFQSAAPLLPHAALAQERRQHWLSFWQESRIRVEEAFAREGVKYGFASDAFDPFFLSLDRDLQPFSAQQMLDGPLAPVMASMLDIADGPDIGGLAMTTVAVDDNKLDKLSEYADSAEGVRVVANGVWRARVESLLKTDILRLSAWAGGLVGLLTLILFRRLGAVLAVLAPVLAALSAMALFSRLTGSQLHTMHLLMGIMVIGLSVDYGIFVVCAKLDGVSRVSRRAVSICAASSLLGFGVLAFAQHPALHALGVTVLVGIGAAWPTALWVSPTLLGSRGRG